MKGEGSNVGLIEARELMETGREEGIIKIEQSQSEDDDKLVRGFVMNIVNNSNGGCAADKIFSMLRGMYMVGHNIQRHALEDLLRRMTQE